MAYFISEGERRAMERRAARVKVDDEWRGWSYEDGPVAPPYGVKFPVSVIAGKYCETGRDVYLSFVEGFKAAPSMELKIGAAYHEVIARIANSAKQLIYRYGVISGADLYDHLVDAKRTEIEDVMRGCGLDPSRDVKVKVNIERLWLYESMKISCSLNEQLSRGGKGLTNLDVLVQSSIPFLVEYPVDGSRIGLSENLRVDALLGFTTVLDLKTGRERRFHRLSTAGYAMALESMTGHPINVGCTVYLEFRRDTPTPIVRRRMYVIEEPLRRWFIDERDEKMEIVANARDPGMPARCSSRCPYYGVCREVSG